MVGSPNAAPENAEFFKAFPDLDSSSDMMKYNHAPLRFNCKGFIMPMIEEKTPPEDVVAPTYMNDVLCDENIGSTA